MSDSMASRVTRLISASLNALIDKAEGVSPQMVMQEGIREVEKMIDEVKIALGKESVHKLQFEHKTDTLTQEYEKLTKQIEIALKEEREELAKSAISKQIDLESQALGLKSELSQISQNITKLEGYIDALSKKRGELKKELEEFIKINQSQHHKNSINTTVNKIDNLFDRLSTSGSSVEISQEDVDLTQLDTLAKEHEIAQRLEAFKTKK